MSLFIKFQRPGGLPRMLRFRGLRAVLGEDEHGIVSPARVQKPYFAFYAIGERYLLRIETEGFNSSGTPLRAGQEYVLDKPLVLARQDLEFTLMPASNLAEILASDRLSLEELAELGSEKELPRLIYHLAGSERSYALHEKVALRVGSALTDHILVEIEGVQPSHCLVAANPRGVTVKALNGLLENEKGENVSEIQTATSMRFRLAPSGLELQVKMK